MRVKRVRVTAPQEKRPNVFGSQARVEVKKKLDFQTVPIPILGLVFATINLRSWRSSGEIG